MQEWLKSLKIYTEKRMLVMLLLGFVSGLPYLLVSSTLSLWLKDAGISLATIGFFSLIKAPYSFKWLFSPLIDQYKLPLFSRLGRRRGWAVFLQILLISSLLLMSITNPGWSPSLFALWVFLTVLFSASQDIVLDAYRIESFKPKEQAAGVAVFVLGYRIGAIFSGAGALFLASVLKWEHVYQIMAIGILIGLITVLLSKEPENNTPSQPKTLRATIVNAVVKPFTDFMKRKNWGLILIFIFLYRMSDSYIAPMSYPFFDDMGFSKMQIATVIKIYGVIATIIGTLLGGALVNKTGLPKALLICGFLQGLSNLVYVGQVYAGNNVWVLTVNIFIENVSGGMGTAAFVAYLSSLCSKKYTATQYALLSSFMGAARDLFASTSGIVASALSWPAFFVLTTFMAVPGMTLLWYLVKTKTLTPCRVTARKASRLRNSAK
jgi:PAT family beta-lactamase induction signal transducer AmpG